MPNITRRVRSELSKTIAGLGSGRRCPLCAWEGRHFVSHGRPPKVRVDARCPSCGSLERDRLAFRLLSDRLEPAQTTLHSAPERAIQPWLKRLSESYVSIDINPRNAQRVEDLTGLTFDDASFTFVYCSNVLEHIPDDHSALSEIRRVLRAGGHAALMVPIRGETTDEDPSVTSPEERLARYTQRDHVRFYGLDFADRIRAAGFDVEVLDDRHVASDLVESERLVYPTTRHVFFATAV